MCLPTAKGMQSSKPSIFYLPLLQVSASRVSPSPNHALPTTVHLFFSYSEKYLHTYNPAAFFGAKLLPSAHETTKYQLVK